MSTLGPAGSSRAWRRLRLAVLERDAWRCRVRVDDAGRIVAAPAGRPCMLPADRVDHIVPRTLGGGDDPDNLRAACDPHNLTKGGRLDGETGPRRTGRQGRGWSW